MNSELIQITKDLESLLIKYSKTERAAELSLNALKSLFDSIIDGTVELPISSVPRSYDFHEGDLRKYEDLEAAYSKFATRAKGYDLDSAREFFKELREK